MLVRAESRLRVKLDLVWHYRIPLPVLVTQEPSQWNNDWKWVACENFSGIYFCTLLFVFNNRFKTRPNINKNCVRTESFFSIYFLAEIFDPAGDLNRFGIRLLKVFLCLGVKFWIYFLSLPGSTIFSALESCLLYLGNILDWKFPCLGVNILCLLETPVQWTQL